MDPRRQQAENQLYHFSPAQSPGDTYCEGSDSEQTPAQIREKRQRYEEHASRYLKGHIPVLLSAKLKGPFHKQSGWQNPWRQRPRKVQRDEQEEDEWWQPGSDDMLFTRKRVMKRATDHGMGNLTPAEALEWCKSCAEVEAEASNGGVLQSMEVDDGEVISDLTTEQPCDSKSRKRPPNITEKVQSTSPSSVSPNDGTKPGREEAIVPMYSKKRALDASWLKGSYVSKRARWDGPATTTPTPREPRGPHRQEALHVGSIRGGSSFTKIEQVVVKTTASLLRPFIRDQDMVVIEPLRGTRDQSNQSLITPYQHANGTQLSGLRDKLLSESGQNYDYSNRMIMDHEQSISAMRFPHSSNVSLCKVTSDGVSQDQQAIPHILTEPQFQESYRQHTPVFISTSSKRGLSFPSIRSGASAQSELSDEMGDVSFVTEVAPSCRGLEKFEYRKKRRIGHSAGAVQYLPPEPRQEDSVPQQFQVISENCDLHSPVSEVVEASNGDEWETDLDSVADVQDTTLPGIASDEDDWDTTIKSTEHDRTNAHLSAVLSKIRSASPSKSCMSDSSWEYMDNVTIPPSHGGGVISRSSSGRPSSSKRHIILDPVAHLQLEQVSTYSSPPDNTREEDVVSSLYPRQSGHYLEASAHYDDEFLSSNLVPDPIILAEPLDQNDISTQSRNTTPSRSAGILQSSSNVRVNAEAIPPNTTRGETSDPVVGDINSHMKDEMDAIQQSLSQACHGLDSVESSNSKDTAASSNVEEHDNDSEEFSHSIKAPQSPFQPPLREISERFSKEDHLKSKASSTTNQSISDSTKYHISSSRFASKLHGTSSQVTQTPSTQPRIASQYRGVQSPWGDESFELPTDHRDIVYRKETPPCPLREYTPHRSSPSSHLEQLGWQEELPVTPRIQGIKPFEEFKTPILSPDKKLPADDETTSNLVDATADNPWASCLKKGTIISSKKRVSFAGFLPSPNKHLEAKAKSPQDIPGSPPPPPTRMNEYNEDEPSNKKFDRHFKAARKFNKILPDKSASQMNSSPAAIDAMAEAFIAADRDASSEQENVRVLSKSSIQYQRSSNFGTNTSWGGSPEHDSSSKRLGNTTSAATKELSLTETLGGLDDFLEDWSVESELKKARETEGKRTSPSRARARNSYGGRY